MVTLLLLACVNPPEATPAPTLVALDAPRLARRLSLDLRGTLPSVAELDAVEADPDALDALRDAWLDDPRFEARLVTLYQERWGTSLDEFRGYYYEFGLPPEQEYAFVRAIGEEPLRLVARVVADDRPYTEIVTADWTMADPLLASVFPIEGVGDGWSEARYTDGRPAAGVLTTNGLWWRYISPINNFNRARTAAILDLLVCEDLLVRPVVFATALSIAADEASAAVRTEPACLSCHATVEPIAATLFGFLNQDDQSALEMTRYHPERETNGPATLLVEPAWYGQPVDGLDGLGRAIALDPRFVDCGVRTMAEALLRRPTAAGDAALLRDAREAFVDADLRMKAVVRAVTDAEAYRAGGVTDAATDADAEGETTRRMLVTAQLRSALADLAGYTWERAGWDQLDADRSGYRVMAGSVDGEALTAPQATPGLTWALVARRAAQSAARHLVDADLGAAAPTVFVHVTADTPPDDPAFRAQLEELHWRLLATRADADTLDGLTALWSQVEAATGSPAEAWASVVTVLLRDPDFLTY